MAKYCQPLKYFLLYWSLKDNNIPCDPTIRCLSRYMFVSVPSQKLISNATYVIVYFVFTCLRWEVVLRFTDIGGTVDQYFFNIYFHNRILIATI